jgi:hypothetical protein
LISGVITGVTAGAMGLAGAAGIADLLRFAALRLAGFFFAALREGFRLPAFFFDDFFFEAFFFDFFATRFFDERFFDDFFLAVFFLEDFFFAAFFFVAVVVLLFNVDRLSDVRPPDGSLFALPSVRIRIERDW